MYQFDWRDFDEKTYNDCVKSAHAKDISTIDYVGAVHVGDLCFDLSLIDRTDTEPLYIQYDLYVGGVDSGYGYSESGYPYDYFDGGCFYNDVIDMPYADFQSMAEKELTEFIDAEGFRAKANEHLHIW